MGRASLSRRAPGLVALCVGVSVPGVAAASLPPIAWDAPAGCPDADALAGEVARHVDATAIAAESTSIRVRARPQERGWSVVVAIDGDGRTQERTLAVDSCEAAVRAAAFVIALAVDPARRESQDVVPVPPEAPPAPPVVKAVPRVVAENGPEPPVNAPDDVDALEAPLAELDPPPTPARRRSIRGLLQVGPGLQAGMLPVDAGLTVATGLLWPRARLVFGYTRWFRTAVRRSGERPYGADFSVHAGHVRAGPVVRAGPLELPLHVGVELGALQAVGVGGDDNYEATALWGAATVGAGLTWAPRALRGFAALVVLAEAAIALRRPLFVFAGDLEVHRVGAAAFRGFVLIEARFP